MWLKIVWCLLVAINTASASDVKICEKMIQLYESLGCEPLHKSTVNMCLSSYQCPEFHKFDPNKCYFRGKIFNIREDHIADETEATERCEVSCECYKFDENTPAEFECPEDDSCDVGITECIIQYSTAEKCCSDLKVCDDAEIKRLKTCHLEGETVYLKQFIEPKSDPCYSCYCTENFENTTSVPMNPDCIKFNCTYGLLDFDQFRSSCVPIFYEKSCCAQMDFKCPNHKDAIDPESKLVDKTDADICKFGNLTLKRGEKLKNQQYVSYDGAHTSVSCKCVLPPFVTCSRIDS